LKKENEDLKNHMKDNVNVGKLDGAATQNFEKNPLEDKMKELERGVAVLQDKIGARDKEIARLKEDLENAVKHSDALKTAAAIAG
jgi:uncharacterized small protein (DUF1192 family)